MTVPDYLLTFQRAIREEEQAARERGKCETSELSELSSPLISLNSLNSRPVVRQNPPCDHCRQSGETMEVSRAGFDARVHRGCLDAWERDFDERVPVTGTSGTSVLQQGPDEPESGSSAKWHAILAELEGMDCPDRLTLDRWKDVLADAETFLSRWGTPTTIAYFFAARGARPLMCRGKG